MTTPSSPDAGPVFLEPWGPFLLASPWEVDPDKLDAKDSDSWCLVGLSVDPQMLDNDFRKVLRHIQAFMGLNESITGLMWSIEPESLAMRIALAEGPVVLRLWK